MALFGLDAPVAMLLAAFAGGAFGAAIGALPAFVFTGVLVIVGEAYRLSMRAFPADGVAGSAPPPGTLTGSLAFGVFGPHVTFAGGAAAAAYAARRGRLTDGVHPAKQITRGLGTRPDVLAVGGIFGVIGFATATLSGWASLPWDPVAFGVVVSALAHRAALGHALVGPVRGLLDSRGFAPAARADGGRATADAAAVVTWLPHQYRWRDVAGLGLAGGVLGAYVTYATGSAFLAFGVSAASLLFICAGADDVPVTHHLTLPASTGVLALAGASGPFLPPAAVAAALPLSTALAVGAGLGLLGALLGELAQRWVYARAETHLDPPAASIVATSALLAGLAALGVVPGSAWVPLP